MFICPARNRTRSEVMGGIPFKRAVRNRFVPRKSFTTPFQSHARNVLLVNKFIREKRRQEYSTEILPKEAQSLHKRPKGIQNSCSKEIPARCSNRGKVLRTFQGNPKEYVPRKAKRCSRKVGQHGLGTMRIPMTMRSTRFLPLPSMSGSNRPPIGFSL